VNPQTSPQNNLHEARSRWYLTKDWLQTALIISIVCLFTAVPVPAQSKYGGIACYLAHQKRIKEAMKLPRGQMEAAVRESARQYFACLKREGYGR
jgi:hypothetical protein